jgi:hypothetical protein
MASVGDTLEARWRWPAGMRLARDRTAHRPQGIAMKALTNTQAEDCRKVVLKPGL